MIEKNRTIFRFLFDWLRQLLGPGLFILQRKKLGTKKNTWLKVGVQQRHTCITCEVQALRRFFSGRPLYFKDRWLRLGNQVQIAQKIHITCLDPTCAPGINDDDDADLADELLVGFEEGATWWHVQHASHIIQKYSKHVEIQRVKSGYDFKILYTVAWSIWKS